MLVSPLLLFHFMQLVFVRRRADLLGLSAKTETHRLVGRGIQIHDFRLTVGVLILHLFITYHGTVEVGNDRSRVQLQHPVIILQSGSKILHQHIIDGTAQIGIGIIRITADDG